jgi:hypothetical protein
MDIQAHARTQQIKELSQCLYNALTGLRYLLFLGWPAILFLAFFAEGELHVGESSLLIEKLGVFSKSLILFLFALGLILMLRINHHFRELMRHFTRGNVFSIHAITHVRGALKNGILFFALSLFQELAGWIYTLTNAPTFNISFTGDIIIAGIFFGLMYTLLWTFEIGCDLNEESDLTI